MFSGIEGKAIPEGEAVWTEPGRLEWSGTVREQQEFGVAEMYHRGSWGNSVEDGIGERERS